MITSVISLVKTVWAFMAASPWLASLLIELFKFLTELVKRREPEGSDRKKVISEAKEMKKAVMRAREVANTTPLSDHISKM